MALTGSPLFRCTGRFSRWHPGHQKAALQQLKDGIHQIDLVLEVRDARIPLSSYNPQFEESLGRRDRMIVFNKADLSNHNMNKNLANALAKHQTDPFVFTCASQKKTLAPIIQYAVNKVRQSPEKYPYLSMVIVGPPNVGKSSLINALRMYGVGKGKTAAVADYAGVTQTIQTRVKIFDNPPIYLVDTPGILDPKYMSPIQGLRVALTGGTKDSMVDLIQVANYLLFRLNQSRVCVDRYTKHFGFDSPQTDIDTTLRMILAWNQQKRGESERTPQLADDVAAAKLFIKLFREGQFGPLTLDDCTVSGLERWFQNKPLLDSMASVPEHQVVINEAGFETVTQVEGPKGRLILMDELNDASKEPL